MFEHVTVVDVTNGQRYADQRVVIVGHRIQAVGTADAVPKPAGARVIEARGKYMIPGLWDMHVHPMLFPDRVFPLLVANGVTGMRDAGTPALDSAKAWRRAVLAGTRVGPPRQLLSGGPLDGPPPPPDEAKDQEPCGHFIFCLADSAAVHRVVDSLQAAGADMLKMYGLSKPLYFMVAAEARRVGIRFGGHTRDVSVLEASDSGASIVDHAADAGAASQVGSMHRCVHPTATAEACRPVAEHFQANGTWWVPTLALLFESGYYRTLLPHGALSDTIVQHYRQFVSAFVDGTASSSLPLDQASVAAVAAAQADTAGGILRLAARLGVPMLAGTDAMAVNLGLLPYEPPGFTLHVELALYVAEGLTPLQALQTATLNPAKFLHATDSLGTVTAGKLADLVLLDADPLVAITNTQRIQAVVANGRYFDRAQLDALWQQGQASLGDGGGWQDEWFQENRDALAAAAAVYAAQHQSPSPPSSP